MRNAYPAFDHCYIIEMINMERKNTEKKNSVRNKKKNHFPNDISLQTTISPLCFPFCYLLSSREANRANDDFSSSSSSLFHRREQRCVNRYSADRLRSTDSLSHPSRAASRTMLFSIPSYVRRSGSAGRQVRRALRTHARGAPYNIF